LQKLAESPSTNKGRQTSTSARKNSEEEGGLKSTQIEEKLKMNPLKMVDTGKKGQQAS